MSAENLETNFDNLCITPVRKTAIGSRSVNYIPNRCWKLRNPKKRKSLHMRYYKRDIRDTIAIRAILRPAKLNLDSVSKKTSLIRPARLNLKKPKVFLLKPATLIVEDKCKLPKKSKFVISCAPDRGVPFSVGQVFSCKNLNSQCSFKSLVTNEYTEISKAFDALSFKKLRQTKSPSSEVLTANKRENTSSCSIQARMESSVQTDCDDTSIEELASYFDLFVHIPKKMSSMAEMMYI